MIYEQLRLVIYIDFSGNFSHVKKNFAVIVILVYIFYL